MKINQVECFKSDQINKYEIGTIIRKESNYFLVKTKDSFLKVISYEYDGKIEEGNKFEVQRSIKNFLRSILINEKLDINTCKKKFKKS